MKNLTLLLICIIVAGSLHGQVKKYSKVKVYADEIQLKEMALAGIDITEGYHKPGEFLICDYSENEISKIKESGIEYEILIEDVLKYYAERNIGFSTNPDDYKGVSEWEVPENFDFGSMGGHCTFDEVVAHLDNMVGLFPDLISAKESIGQSIEERELWMVKISDNPNVNETEPEVLYTSLHHAREPAGVMTVMFHIYYLLENYDDDPLIKHIVDNTEMYFVPVVNPDGYVHNEQTDPNGGGMWRKNRRDNGIPEPECWGVDLNRNYDYMWGYDDVGSSPNPCDETYRGNSAFSEPETIALRDFCENHEFKFALNYHTFGNLLVFPWGYTTVLCPDEELFYDFASVMTEDNQYNYGSNVLYEANGIAGDWMYGEQTTKEKIFPFLPELGNSTDGFWCPVNRIIPIAQENMIQNIRVALFPGIYALAEETGSPIIEDESGNLYFDLKRYGLEDGGIFTVSLEPVSGNILSTGDPKVYTGLDILETVSDSISYTLDPSLPNGTWCEFLLSVDNGEFVLSDTISKVFGEPVTIFEDACDNMDNWWSPFWDVTTTNYNSPPGSITDSPSGNYPNSSIRDAIMTTSIDIPDGTLVAILNFYAHWEIEENYDFAQLLISTDGMSWTALEGNYTVISTPDQSAQPLPVYEGFQTNWVQEEIDLSAYIGNSVSLKFTMKSNDTINEDGFYFDDLSLKVIAQPVTVEEFSSDNDKSIAFEIFPNPTNDVSNLSFGLSGSSHIIFKIYDLLGQEVMTIVDEVRQAGKHVVRFDASSLKPGVYFCLLKTNLPAGGQTKRLVRLE